MRQKSVQKPFPIVGSFAKEKVDHINAARTINCYEYETMVNGEPKKSLLQIEGTREIGTNLGTFDKGFRGSFKYHDTSYHVIGERLYKLSNSFEFEFLYELDTETGYVGIAANNGSQIMIVDGVAGYVVPVAGGLITKITNATHPNFPANPVDIACLKGYMTVIDGQEQPSGFYLPALNDATDWTVLQRGQVDGDSNLKAVRVLHGQLFFFKEYTTAVWYDAGIGAELPFRDLPNEEMPFGTVNAANVAVAFNRIIFLSQTREGLSAVREISGSNAVPVSPPALLDEFQSYIADPAKGVGDAAAFLEQKGKLIFYRLNFTAANKTWVFNVTQSSSNDLRWHEEEMLNHDRHFAQTHVNLNGKNYYGHYSLSNFYEVSAEYVTNDGEAIVPTRIIAPFPTLNRIRVDRFHLDLQQGELFYKKLMNETVFLATESGDILSTESGDELVLDFPTQEIVQENATVFLSLSYDGGQTFGPRLEAPLGELGDRAYWTAWRRLGSTKRGQDFVCRFEFYYDIPMYLLEGVANYVELPQ